MDELTFSVSQIARGMGTARDTVSRKLAADARMGADPANCRSIRMEAEQAISTLATTIKPCAGWPLDKQSAFEQWRVEQIVGLALG